jgi:hypothetical protein
MITKEYGEDKDFYSEGGALTLPFDDIQCGTSHEETFSSGWTIKGEVTGDYWTYMNEFEATHPLYGKVWGDFEDEVYADTEEGFQHFYANHPPEAWDYWDV